MSFLHSPQIFVTDGRAIGFQTDVGFVAAPAGGLDLREAERLGRKVNALALYMFENCGADGPFELERSAANGWMLKAVCRIVLTYLDKAHPALEQLELELD